MDSLQALRRRTRIFFRILAWTLPGYGIVNVILYFARGKQFLLLPFFAGAAVLLLNAALTAKTSKP